MGILAEEEGFEPSVHVLRIRLISNEVVSAAHPLLRKGQIRMRASIIRGDLLVAQALSTLSLRSLDKSVA